MRGYDADYYEAVLGRKPMSIFRKTITGKVVVRTLNPIDIENNAEVLEVVLEGDNNSKSAMIMVFSNKELAYFKRANKSLLRRGILEEIDPDVLKDTDEDEVYVTEDEIEKKLSDKYFKRFEKFLNEYATDPIKMARVIEIARKMDLPKTRVNAIKAKVLELGMQEVEL